MRRTVAPRVLRLCGERGLVLLFLAAAPAWAEQGTALGTLTPYLRIAAELRARVEYNNFFRPEPAFNNDNEYVFGATRARLGLGATTSWVDAFVQLEQTSLYGVPDDSVAAPGGALGTGALYFAEDPRTTQADIHLKALFFTLKPALVHVPGLSFTVGRFEILDGLEYRTGDAKFDFLKTARISQRLLGSFDFAHATRNFDGVMARYDHPAVNVTVSATHPTEGGFNISAQNEITGIDLIYGAVTAKPGLLLPGAEGRLFYLYYGDDRPVQVVDNRAAARRPFLNARGLTLHNLGGHALTTAPLGPGVVDGLVWGDYQFGDWTDLDHKAWAVAVEAGYQWTGLPLAPWIRVGYFRGSGDDNASDRTHRTFYNVLPTVRTYANFPFYNLMNIQDRFTQVILAPVRDVRIRADYHALVLSESKDLFYSGAGAQRRTGAFGYAGRPSGGARSLAEVVEASLSHTVNRHFSWNVYYGHAFGGSVIRRFFRGRDDADYAFLEFTAKF